MTLNHGACDGESLTGASPHFFGGKKGVEDPVANLFWNSGARVGDSNERHVAFHSGLDADGALPACSLHHIPIA